MVFILDLIWLSIPGALCRGSIIRYMRIATGGRISAINLASITGLLVLATAGWAVANFDTLPGRALVAVAAASLLGMVIPFRKVMAAIVILGAMTLLVITVGNTNLRLDVALAPVAFFSAMSHGYMGKVLHWATRPPILLMAAWIALQAFVSYRNSVDVAASMNMVVWFAANLLIVVLALAAYGNDREKLEQLLLTAAVLVSISGLLAWMQAALSGEKNWGANGIAGFGLRAHGLAFEPNILGVTAAFWVLVILTRKKVSRPAWWALALFVIVIPLTSTRSAIVAVAVGFGIYILSKPSRIRRVFPIVLVGGLGFWLVSVIAPASLKPIMAKMADLDFDNQTSTFRYDSWAMVFEDLSGNWLFGLGTNSFQQRHLDPTRLDIGAGYYLGNLPLQVLHDSGIVGVVLVGCAALAVFKRGSAWRRLGLLAAFVIISIATSPFFFANWWLLIALALAQKNPALVPERKPHKMAARTV